MAFLGTIRILIIDMLRGTNILWELKRISKEQYLTRGELDYISSLKTKKVIAYAISHIPYYKKFREKSKFPVLIKDLIRGHGKDFL